MAREGTRPSLAHRAAAGGHMQELDAILHGLHEQAERIRGLSTFGQFWGALAEQNRSRSSSSNASLSGARKSGARSVEQPPEAAPEVVEIAPKKQVRKSGRRIHKKPADAAAKQNPPVQRRVLKQPTTSSDESTSAATAAAAAVLKMPLADPIKTAEELVGDFTALPIVGEAADDSDIGPSSGTDGFALIPARILPVDPEAGKKEVAAVIDARDDVDLTKPLEVAIDRIVKTAVTCLVQAVEPTPENIVAAVRKADAEDERRVVLEKEKDELASTVTKPVSESSGASSHLQMQLEDAESAVAATDKSLFMGVLSTQGPAQYQERQRAVQNFNALRHQANLLENVREPLTQEEAATRREKRRFDRENEKESPFKEAHVTLVRLQNEQARTQAEIHEEELKGAHPAKGQQKATKNEQVSSPTEPSIGCSSSGHSLPTSMHARGPPAAAEPAAGAPPADGHDDDDNNDDDDDATAKNATPPRPAPAPCVGGDTAAPACPPSASAKPKDKPAEQPGKSARVVTVVEPTLPPKPKRGKKGPPACIAIPSAMKFLGAPVRTSESLSPVLVNTPSLARGQPGLYGIDIEPECADEDGADQLNFQGSMTSRLTQPQHHPPRSLRGGPASVATTGMSLATPGGLSAVTPGGVSVVSIPTPGARSVATPGSVATEKRRKKKGPPTGLSVGQDIVFTGAPVQRLPPGAKECDGMVCATSLTSPQTHELDRLLANGMITEESFEESSETAGTEFSFTASVKSADGGDNAHQRFRNRQPPALAPMPSFSSFSSNSPDNRRGDSQTPMTDTPDTLASHPSGFSPDMLPQGELKRHGTAHSSASSRRSSIHKHGIKQGVSGDHRSKEFTLHNELGQGAFGKVQKASTSVKTSAAQPSGNGAKNYKQVFVAIKTVPLPSADLITKDLEYEIAWATQEKHESLVRTYESFYVPMKQELWIVLEYMNLGDLASVLKKCGKEGTPDEVISAVFFQVLRALNFLHARRKPVLHRDLKPPNILLNSKGSVKISDFGAAISAGTLGTAQTFAAGTQAYMSPERMQGERYGTTSDIYSAGLIAAELHLGGSPLGDDVDFFDVIEAKRKFSVSFHARVYETNALLADFVAQATAQNPENRSSAEALLGHKFIAMTPSQEEAKQRVRTWATEPVSSSMK